MTGRASLIGYLSDCGVYLDANGDGVAGSDEIAAKTDSFGGYSFATASLDAGVAKVVVSTDATTYPDCVDTFTAKAPGVLHLETPASSTQPVAATALTTLAAALVRGVDGAASAAKTSGQANLWLARAFGLDDATSFTLDTTDYLALAASDTSGDAANVFVAASSCANVIATLTALLTPACGGAAAAERFVADAVGRRVVAARTSSSRRRRLSATSAVDLESSSVIEAIADDSVTTAVAEGTIAYAADVNPDAVSAVASASAAAAAHLKTAAASAKRDPLAFVKTAAAVSSVIQSPEMRTAIQAASVKGVPGLESTVAASASSSTLLADMGDPEKLSAAVTKAEASVAVEIPKSPPPPVPPPPPTPPPVAAQPLPSATPSNYTRVTEADPGSQGSSSGGARPDGWGFPVATLAALAACVFAA